MLLCIPTSTSKTQFFVNQAYADYIHEAGFVPMLATPHNDALVMAATCDGLILPGGIDIDPTFYGEDNIHSLSVDPAKDDFERKLLYAFLHEGKPVFGICRGFQLIIKEWLRHTVKAIKRRLSFYQHINHHSLAHELDLDRSRAAHHVFADRNVLYGESHKQYRKMFVNSMHHQYLWGEPHQKDIENRWIIGDLRILAQTRYGTSAKEKGTIIEAFDIHNWGNGRILAVQWHPEEMKDVTLLQTFFNGEQGEHVYTPAPETLEVEAE